MIVGKKSFNRKSLHAIGNTPNPYEQAISIIGRTLSPFDEDNLIPCFGFGDGQSLFTTLLLVPCLPLRICCLNNLIFLLSFVVASTHDQYVFSFCQENRYCHGFEEALARYREIVPYIKLSGLDYVLNLFFCNVVEVNLWSIKCAIQKMRLSWCQNHKEESTLKL